PRRRDRDHPALPAAHAGGDRRPHVAGGLERARTYFTHLGYRGFFVHDGHIKPIERFSIDRMQHPANLPDLTAPLQARQRFGRYIYNFIFLPSQEPELTVWKMSERLHKLAQN